MSETTIYLIRHAQSRPSREQAFHTWPLSPLGLAQAEALALLLVPLGIERIYASPFRRCAETIRPFAAAVGLEPTPHHGLRERLFQDGFAADLRAAWRRSWEDFNFNLPGGESSRQAQERFLAAMADIARDHPGETVAVATHGNVISLFLNHLEESFGRERAEAIRNPDVMLIRAGQGRFHWHADFALPGLAEISSHHDDTPGMEELLKVKRPTK